MAKHAERPRVRRCVATRDAIYILRPVIEAVYVADQTLGKSENRVLIGTLAEMLYSPAHAAAQQRCDLSEEAGPWASRATPPSSSSGAATRTG